MRAVSTDEAPTHTSGESEGTKRKEVVFEVVAVGDDDQCVDASPRSAPGDLLGRPLALVVVVAYDDELPEAGGGTNARRRLPAIVCSTAVTSESIVSMPSPADSSRNRSPVPQRAKNPLTFEFRPLGTTLTRRDCSESGVRLA